jgi:hypothetical protein
MHAGLLDAIDWGAMQSLAAVESSCSRFFFRLMQAR